LNVRQSTKHRRKKLPKQIVESRQKLRRVPFLGEWKRSWGPPPLHVVIGIAIIPSIFSAILAGLILVLIWIGDFFAWTFAIALAAILVVVMHKFHSYVTYLRSFKYDYRVQGDLDGRFEETQMHENEPWTRAVQESVDNELERLQCTYELRSVASRDAAKFDDFLKALHLHTPDMRPRVTELYAIEKQHRRCLFGIIVFQIESQMGKSRQRETMVTYVVYGEIPRDFGRVTIRPREFSDYLASLFTDSDVTTPQPPEFSAKYYCTSSNPDQTQRVLSPQVLTAISAHDKIVIQIHNSIMLVCQDKPIAEIKAAELVALSFDCLDCIANMCITK